jgi:integrase
MSVFKRGQTWWYKFIFSGRIVRESAKTGSKTVAREAERVRRREIEESYNNLADRRDERIRTVRQTGTSYLEGYRLKNPRSVVFAEYAIKHINQSLGETMLADINEETVKTYQLVRLRQDASPKTVNEEVGFLLRMLGEQGDALRIRMKRTSSLKLKAQNEVGKAFSQDQKEALLKAASVKALPSQPTGPNILTQAAKKGRGGTRSPFILPALALAFSAGMRNSEIRNLTWGQIDFDNRLLTVGKSKTTAGEGRVIPLNDDLFAALIEHARWYTGKFQTTKLDWYIFPARVGRPSTGNKRPFDPTKPVTTIKTSWRNVKKLAGIVGRFHDARHTLITELCEAAAGDQTIMEIAGHVSPQMLKRYSHIRMAAKRKALDSIQSKPEIATTALIAPLVQEPVIAEDTIQ